LYKQEAKELIEKIDMSKGRNLEIENENEIENEKSSSKEMGIILLKNKDLEIKPKPKSINDHIVTSFKLEVTEIVNYKENKENEEVVKNKKFDGAEFRIPLLLDSNS